jgi:hypothetical protein
MRKATGYGIEICKKQLSIADHTCTSSLTVRKRVTLVEHSNQCSIPCEDRLTGRLTFFGSEEDVASSRNF